MPIRNSLKRLVPAATALGCFFGLTGFGGDLSPIPFFPSVAQENDALCQSYGYPPGSRLYALCRERKDRIAQDSHAMGFPDVTPIPLLLFVDPRPIW